MFVCGKVPETAEQTGGLIPTGTSCAGANRPGRKNQFDFGGAYNGRGNRPKETRPTRARTSYTGSPTRHRSGTLTATANPRRPVRGCFSEGLATGGGLDKKGAPRAREGCPLPGLRQRIPGGGVESLRDHIL